MIKKFKKYFCKTRIARALSAIGQIYSDHHHTILHGLSKDYTFSVWVLKNQKWHRLTEIKRGSVHEHYLNGIRVDYSAMQSFDAHFLYKDGVLHNESSPDIAVTWHNPEVSVITK